MISMTCLQEEVCLKLKYLVCFQTEFLLFTWKLQEYDVPKVHDDAETINIEKSTSKTTDKKVILMINPHDLAKQKLYLNLLVANSI